VPEQLARWLHRTVGAVKPAIDDHMTVLAGPASGPLGAAICASLETVPAPYECRRFPDGETQIELNASVRGHDVYILQATGPPVEQHLVELLLLADACRRAGAARLTAVIPYFGYARQDRRIDRRSLGARVAANLVGTAGLDRLMLIDAHTPTIEGFFDVPLDHLTAVPLLARAAAGTVGAKSVVVAPDLGAVKLARAYANQLHLPMAFIHKTRLDGEAVEAHAVIGDVRGRLPLIVDDMLSTGATIEAAAGALRAAGAVEPVSVAVTHALMVGRAREILLQLPLGRLMVSDTVTIAPTSMARLEITSVAPLVATAIRRNHQGESLADLRATV
jgi:ribose-phosphate pyrophosphokinase